MFDLIRVCYRIVPKRWRRSIWLSLMIFPIVALVELASVLMIGYFVDGILTDQSGSSDSFRGFSAFANLPQAEKGLVAALAYVVSMLFLLASSLWVSWFTLNIGKDLAVDVFEKYLGKNYLYFLRGNTAEMSRVIFQDVARFTDGVLLPALQSVGKAASVCAIVGLLLVTEWRIALVSVTVFGSIYLGIFLTFKKVLKRMGEKFAFYNDRRFRAVSEALGGIKDCKLNQAEGQFIGRFREDSKWDAFYQVRRRALMQSPRYLLESVAVASILIIGAHWMGKNDVAGSLGLLSIFLLGSYKLLPNLQIIYGNLATLRSSLDAVDTIKSVKGEADYGKSFEGARGHQDCEFSVRSEIALRNVSFSYDEIKPVLNSVDLVIPFGKRIGFTGTSGSGKTTLMDLLLGLLDSYTGDVIVDGLNMRSIDRAGWQRQIGYVPQDIHLIDATISENVAFGVPADEIDRGRVVELLKKVDLLDLLESQFDGNIDSMLGEGGNRLSGGQRQRFGLARALYRNPTLLVLDEATSSLDSETEKRVMKSIYELSEGITVLIIAHRISTMSGCDEIFVMEEGRIVRSGSYDEVTCGDEVVSG